MKIKLFGVSFLFLLISTIDGKGQEFIPGIIGGINFSSIKSEQIESTARRGLEIGTSLTYRMGDSFDLITEFGLSQKGANAKGRTHVSSPGWWAPGGLSTETTDFKLYINSINWSVIANYYIIAPNFSLQAGPVIGLFSFPRIIQDNPNNVSFNTPDNPDETINASSLEESFMEGMDYSLAFGISGGSEALRVNLRYQLGLKNYYKNIDYDGNGYRVKSNLIQLSLAYSFLKWRWVR